MDQSQQELLRLEREINQSDFWSDQENAKNVSRQYEALRQEINAWQELKNETADLLELAKLDESNPELKDNLIEKFQEIEKKFAVLEFNLMFSGESDKSNVILSIHAGTGGVDAQDWAQILLRMYLRFCERHDFAAKIVEETAGAEAGIKSVTIEVNGRYAYGWLRSENGVHRLVRISPFDAEKMRHTSFALVEVLPEMENVGEINIKDEDLKVDVFRSGGSGGQSVNTTDSAVRITHLPTGVVVKCQNERSQAQNKNLAMKVLRAKLAVMSLEQQEADLQKLKGEHRKAQWGNQARSYVLQPYHLVKDHRTELETQDTDRILNGEFDDFCVAYLRQQLEK